MFVHKIGGIAQPFMVHVHKVARAAQATSLMVINTFLKEGDSALILTPGVLDEILKFCEAKRHLEQEVGPNWLLYAKATHHPEAAKVTPSAFPKLAASAALYHASETSATMKNHWQGCPILGGTPETKLQDTFCRKLKKQGSQHLLMSSGPS